MSSTRAYRAILVATPLALLSACGSSEADANGPAANRIVGTPETDAEKLARAGDNDWINISGQVISAGPRSFVVDNGRGNVTVEMDDWDWYKEGAGLKAGDQVVVSGRVDNDFVAKKRIEASSVYVRNLGTYFYANAADEETVPLPTLGMASAPGQVDATGTVRAVEGREFTIGSGSGPLRVDTSAMAENPLDNDGFLQVKAGDRVYVWGSWDAEMSENPELKAKGVIRFARDGTKADSA